MELSEAHRTLEKLEGVWNGEGDVFPNPWGPAGPTTGEWRFALDRSRFSLRHDFEEFRPDGFVFEAHGVLTVDPSTSEMIWFWFDSYGFPPLDPLRGHWNGDVLSLEKTTPRGIGRTLLHLAPDAFVYTVESRLSGEADFRRVMQGRFRRVE